MKPIKWTQVLVAEGHENDFWVRAYHTEEDAPSFEDIRQAWLDEDMTSPYIEICNPRPYHDGKTTYQFTMENYSEMFDNMEDAHKAMVSWLRNYSDVFGINDKARLSESDSEDFVLDHLSLSYISWCEQNELPAMSMDELLCEELTERERFELTKYIELWEALS